MATIGVGSEPHFDAAGRPADGRMVHLGRDTPFGLVLRSSCGREALEAAIPDQLGLSLMQHAHTE